MTGKSSSGHRSSVILMPINVVENRKKGSDGHKTIPKATFASQLRKQQRQQKYRNNKNIINMMNHPSGSIREGRSFGRNAKSTKSSVVTPRSAVGPLGTTSWRGAEWAANKLQFNDLGVYGRNEEIKELQLAVSRMVGTENISTVSQSDKCGGTEKAEEEEEEAKFNSATNQRQKEFILVSGHSGSGKTTLVSSAIEDMVKQRFGGIFAVGKFDQCLGDGQQQQQQRRPFTAFEMISQVLAQEIKNLKTGTTKKSQIDFERLKDTVVIELGTELIDLIHVFPSLEVIVSTISGTSSTAHNNNNNNNDSSAVGSIDLMYEEDHNSVSSMSKESSSSPYGNITSESRHRFIYAFRILVRIISLFFSPLVLVLDDLQWADIASLDLLEALLSDHGGEQLMVVGIYRSNEVDETHVFHKTLREIRSHALVGEKIRITEMEIGNLHVKAVQEMFESLLSIDTDDQKGQVCQLAEICHRKTNGNAFYLIHFLSKLQDENLLAYNDHVFEWEWNIDAIERLTNATDNVVDILKQEMSTLSPNYQQILKFAAYLGSAFDDRSIYVVWKDYFQKQLQPHRLSENDDSNIISVEQKNVKETIKQSLREGLMSCINAGFLEYAERQEKCYRWAHDKLQEAAMELVAAENHRVFSRQVADALYHNLSDKELKASLFVVANRYNEGSPPHDDTKKLQLANLNLRAAKKSASYSAFESVSMYCEYGIKMLPPDCWENHYRLSLDLFSIGAEAGGFTGNFQKMEEYFNEVLRQKPTASSGRIVSAEGGIRDKLRVYRVMIDSLHKRSMSQQATDMCLHVLQEYGVRFPTKSNPRVFARIMYNMGKIKLSTKSRTDKEARNMRRIDDPVLIEQMSLLDALIRSLYFVDKNLMLLPMFQSFDLTLKHGLCLQSPVVFVHMSFILAVVMGDFAGGATYASYALILLERLDPWEILQVESKTLFITHSVILHWTQPLERLVKPMVRGYEAAIKTGDTEYAMHCMYSFIWNSVISGKALSTIEEDCRMYIGQMKLLKYTLTINSFKMTRQYALNLMGRSQFQTTLTGTEMDEDTCRKEGEEDSHTIPILNLHKIMLYSIFGDHENGAKYSLEMEESIHKTSPGLFYIPIDQFHRCLCLFAMARHLKRQSGSTRSKTRYFGWGMESKCIKSAKQGLEKIKGWIEQGNPNVHHYEALLEAELSAYQGRPFIAKKHYETAITIASQAGFLQDCALANEKYGEFLLQIVEASSMTERKRRKHVTIDNLQEAAFRLQEAVNLYQEWGANAKASHIEAKHSSTLRHGLPSHIEIESE